MSRAVLARALAEEPALVAATGAAEAWTDEDEAPAAERGLERPAPPATPRLRSRARPIDSPASLRRRVRRKVALLGLAAAALTAAGLFHVWVRLRVLQCEVDLGIDLRADEQQEEENARLRAERAWLSRPEAIDAVARGRLGMVAPDPAAIVPLPETAPAGAAAGGGRR